MERLRNDPEFRVSAATRTATSLLPRHVSRFVTGNLAEHFDWRSALSAIDVVVHLAARVHVMSDPPPDPLAEYRSVNVAATANLARQSAANGVRRFVFISSVKVFGDEGSFTETDRPRPTDPYGLSKWEAERKVTAIGTETGMDVVILRPPLVYGRGVGANFGLMLRAIRLGVPMPFGAVHNKRSLISLDNLVDVITLSLSHPAAANEVFLVSDDEDLSTAELIRRLARAANRGPRVFPVPPVILRSAAALIGKRAVATRLLSSLTVDTTKARTRLGWVAPLSVDEGFRRAVGAR